MAEITYAGYVPTSRPDYSALSNDLAQKIYGVLDKRQERRQKLDEVEQANQKLLDSWIPGKTQTLNDFMLNGVDNMRKDLLQWNKDLKAGKMSESEYVRRNRNLEESYQMLANVLKSQDERVNTVMQRQEADPKTGVAPASSYETDYLLKKFGEFSEGIKDKQIKTGSDGRVYLAKVDPETGLVTDQVMDVRSMALPENLAANRVDVPSRVEEITKNWKPDTFWEELGLKGERNIETIRTKNEYKIAKEQAVNAIAPDSNPRAQVSVLVDNGALGDVEYYDTDEEGSQLFQDKLDKLIKMKQDAGLQGDEARPTPAELKEIEVSLIKNVLTPDGVYMPELTKEQQDLAKNLIRNRIDLSFSEKVTGTPKTVYKTTNVTNTGSSKKEKDPDKYAKIVRAWNSRDQLGLQLLNDNSNFSIRVEPDGIAIYDEFDALQHKSKRLDSKFMDIFFGNSPTQIAEGKRQSQKYWSENTPAKKTTNKSTKNKGKGDNIFD